MVGWVLGPVVLGVLWRRFGAPASASRRLFDFAFYGCQTFITLLLALGSRASIVRRCSCRCSRPSGWLLTAAFAWLVSVWLQHPPARRGGFIAAMSQSNNGFTLLGFVALVLFSESGLAQATYSQALAAPFLLLFSFPVARIYSHAGAASGKSLGRILLDNVTDAEGVPAARDDQHRARAQSGRRGPPGPRERARQA